MEAESSAYRSWQYGGPMAGNLLSAGYELAELIRLADVVMTCLLMPKTSSKSI
jgi:3-hydroxyisobutyrate dehydrogenase-like beta-hydroxyacid dehydrogenase